MNQFLLFPVRPKQIVAVLPKRVEIMAAQAPLDAEFEHRLLLRIQVDARLRVDQTAQPTKIRVGDTFVASAHRIAGHAWAGLTPRPLRHPAPSATGLPVSETRTDASSSAEKTRSMSRIMTNWASRFPIPLIKSVRMWVPILGGG